MGLFGRPGKGPLGSSWKGWDTSLGRNSLQRHKLVLRGLGCLFCPWYQWAVTKTHRNPKNTQLYLKENWPHNPNITHHVLCQWKPKRHTGISWLPLSSISQTWRATGPFLWKLDKEMPYVYNTKLNVANKWNCRRVLQCGSSSKLTEANIPEGVWPGVMNR